MKAKNKARERKGSHNTDVKKALNKLFSSFGESYKNQSILITKIQSK